MWVVSCHSVALMLYYSQGIHVLLKNQPVSGAYKSIMIYYNYFFVDRVKLMELWLPGSSFQQKIFFKSAFPDFHFSALIYWNHIPCYVPEDVISWSAGLLWNITLLWHYHTHKAMGFQAVSTTFKWRCIFDCRFPLCNSLWYIHHTARRTLKAKQSFITSFMLVLSIKWAIKIMTVNIIITRAIKLPSV